MELDLKLKGLKIAHEIEHINSLVDKLKSSYYISDDTRRRVVKLIQHDSNPAVAHLVQIFSQPTSVCIPRAHVRSVLSELSKIQEKQKLTALISPNTFDSKEEWFCFLVDSDKLIPSLQDLLLEDDLTVCRYNVMPSLFTIVVFGKKKEEEFFKDFLAACSKQEYFSGMNEEMARRIFKYYGDVVIEGTMDCAYHNLTAGNDMNYQPK